MTKVSFLRLAPLVLALLRANSLFARSSMPPDLDAYVTRALKTFDVPGLSVAIVKDGKVVAAKGYGVRKLGDSAPVDQNTLFGIGSNTKAFTSAALAKYRSRWTAETRRQANKSKLESLTPRHHPNGRFANAS